MSSQMHRRDPHDEGIDKPRSKRRFKPKGQSKKKKSDSALDRIRPLRHEFADDDRDFLDNLDEDLGVEIEFEDDFEDFDDEDADFEDDEDI